MSGSVVINPNAIADNPIINFSNTSYNGNINLTPTGDLRFMTNGMNRLYINQNGDTTVNGKLTVTPTILTTGNSIVTQTGGYNSGAIISYNTIALGNNPYNSVSFSEYLYKSNGNYCKFNIYAIRNNTTTDWSGASLRLQHSVDLTSQGYIEFNNSCVALRCILGGGSINLAGKGLYVDSSGTTNIESNLSITGNVTSILKLTNYHFLANTAQTNANAIFFANTNSTNQWVIEQYDSGYATNSKGKFYISRTGSNDIVIDGNNNPGFVGINTNSPAYQLDVNGTGNFTGTLTVTNGNTSTAFFSNSSTTLGTMSQICIGQATTQNNLFVSHSMGNTTNGGFGSIGVYSASNMLTFDISGFYMGASQVTPPNSGTYRLQVNGSVYLNGYVNTNNNDINVGTGVIKCSTFYGPLTALLLPEVFPSTNTGGQAGTGLFWNIIKGGGIGDTCFLNYAQGGGGGFSFYYSNNVSAPTLILNFNNSGLTIPYGKLLFFKSNNIAFGNLAGNGNQGSYAIAIGYSAGYTGQGENSIAIGSNAGKTNQHGNTIVINATGTDLSSNAENSTYIAPLRSGANVGSGTSTYLMLYNSNTKEVGYSSASTGNTAKTFVIPHPITFTKYLVHACLEGPESGVYYRGKAEIVNNENTSVKLPHYVDAFATDFTVQITPIYNGTEIQTYNVSEVENNQFSVYGKNGKLYWLVQGKRADIEVEPDVSNTQVHGDGPYRWI